MKKTYFVCMSVIDGKIISETVSANNKEDAICMFEKTHNIKPQQINGPFYKKRIEKIKEKDIIFTNKRIKSIFNDWNVIGLITKNPPDSAYLLFDSRVDGKKIPKPKGNYIIKLIDLERNE